MELTITKYKRTILRILLEIERTATFENKAGRFNINKDAEEFYRGLLNLFYGWKLKGLNTDDNPNNAGVDLGDSASGIAVQVTSEKTSAKIHDSIKGFVTECLPNGYKKLYVLMFRGKPEFPKVNFSTSTRGKFEFDKSAHIIDNTDLAKKIANLEFDTLKAIYDYLNEATNLESVKSLPMSRKIPVSKFPQRMEYFTGRTEVLERLKSNLKNYRKVSMHGIHGLGKSSIAVEFAHNYWDKHGITIFVRATRSEFEVSITETLENLGLTFPDKLGLKEKIQVFKSWMSTNEDWLLILDNVEDVALVHSFNLPSDTGYILYTSNSSDIHQIAHNLALEDMSNETAALLLYRLSKQSPEITTVPGKDQMKVSAIAQAFGNSPLAMTFIGSYISQRRKSFEEFWSDYQRSEKNLLRTHNFLTDYQYKEVATAFLHSFDQITKPRNDSADELKISRAVRDYLEVCTYLSPDDMPEEFFVKYLSNKYGEKDLLDNQDLNDSVKERLFRFSIFERNVDEKLLSTHRLVKEIMSLQLRTKGRVAEAMAVTFDQIIPHFNFDEKPVYVRFDACLNVFVGHALELIYVKRNGKMRKSASIRSLFHKLGRYFRLHGKYRSASIVNDVSIRLHKLYAPEDDFSVLETMQNQGVVYTQLGNSDKAEKLFEEVISESLKKKSDGTYQNVGLFILATQNLASLYASQKKYTEAEELYNEAIKMNEAYYGKKHLYTLLGKNNLACLYLETDRFELGEKLLRKIIKTWEKFLPSDHNVGLAYVNLSRVLENKGDFKKAIEWCRKGVEKYKSTFGALHPETRGMLRHLIVLFEKNGEIDDAISVFEEIHKAFEKNVNIDPRTILTEFAEYDDFLQKHERYEKAKPCLKSILILLNHLLEPNHPTILEFEKRLRETEELLVSKT